MRALGHLDGERGVERRSARSAWGHLDKAKAKARPTATAYGLLPTAYCLRPTAKCSLPTAQRPLPNAYCLLPTTYCYYYYYRQPSSFGKSMMR